MTKSTMNWRAISSLLVFFVLSGCAISSEPIVMYDQSEYAKDQIAILLPATSQGIWMVLEIDGRKAGGSCLTGCEFKQPVHISPGRHRFETYNMQGPGFTSLTSTVTFDFEAEVEAGKFYELRIRILPKERGERQKFNVWWEEVEPQS